MKSVLCTIALVCLCSVALLAAGIDGTWYSEVTREGPNGQVTIKTTMNLKADGAKLTGTVETVFGEMAPPPAQIENGKIKGNKFSFTVKREFGGNEMVIKYDGTLEGDVIKGTSVRDGGDRTMPFELKRK